LVKKFHSPTINHSTIYHNLSTEITIKLIMHMDDFILLTSHRCWSVRYMVCQASSIEQEEDQLLSVPALSIQEDCGSTPCTDRVNQAFNPFRLVNLVAVCI
jgi:hypothetical protein